MNKILTASDAKVVDLIEFTDEELENEKWEDIPGYEGYYQVSDLGRVKKYVGIDHFKIITRTASKKGKKGKRYYFYVKLTKDCKGVSAPVHKLSAMAFLGHIPCGYKSVIDHKDNISTNNRKSNLQVVSARYNATKDRVNKTGYTGVSWSSSGNKWTSRIIKEGFYYSLGLFNTKEEASLSYQEASKNLDLVIRPIKSSRYKGLTFDKKRLKWIARTSIKGKQVQIGRYNTEEDAYKQLTKFKILQNK